MDKKEMTSLGELASKFKVRKSRLTYYTNMGLIKPIHLVGRMYLFNTNDTEKKLKTIFKLRKKNRPLNDIKRILDHENK